MLKKMILSCAAIMMLLGQNPALGDPILSHGYEQFIDEEWGNFGSKSPPPQEDYSRSKAKKILTSIETPFKRAGKMLSRAGKAVAKHPVLLSIGMTILGLGAYIVYDQTVNAPQMHKLEEDTDLLKKVTIDTSSKLFDHQNEFVKHIVESFNADQEALLRLNLLLEHNGIKIVDAAPIIPTANAVPTW